MEFVRYPWNFLNTGDFQMYRNAILFCLIVVNLFSCNGNKSGNTDHTMFLSLLFSFFSSSGNNSDNTAPTSPPDPDFTKLNPACFTGSASNPVLTRDSLLSGSDWNDPTVLKINGQYVMYASSDQNFDFNINIYRLVSSDGISWSLNPSTPVFQADANAAAWDHRAVETPSIVYFNGAYHMFYTGYPTTYTDVYSYKIGHATSGDGITWVRDASYIVAPNDPGNPAPDMTFNQWISAEPAAVVFQNKIYLYFSAVGANSNVGTTLQVVGLTTSSDGTTWTTPQSVLTPNQSLYPRGTWLGYSTPNAIVLNGQVHLFFDVVQASPWKQLKIHHASSADDINGWTHDTTAIFSQNQFT
jgi:predicted GH43/DUF377 family glycosyl hydrolase